MRLRVYGDPTDESPTFIELKKKFKGVVYKRRVMANKQDEASDIPDKNHIESSQIHKEIDYFVKHYDDMLMPKVYISYDREAFYCPDDSEFRMTFDFNIKMRDSEVSLYSSNNDITVLDDEFVLLEVKTVQGLPFWLINFFNDNNIYSSSFSKYGSAYTSYILPKIINNFRRVSYA